MNKMFPALFTVSPSPHIHSGTNVNRLMYDVLIALIPAFLVSVWFFGLGALYVAAVSVLSCMLFEWLMQKYMLKKTPTLSDGSAAVTGLLLAFNLPTNIPIWILVVGALFAIGVGKMTFGGLGNNPFNPALVGRVFMLVSFPVQMTTWPLPIVSRFNLETVFNFGRYSPYYIDTYTGATPLGVFSGGEIENLPTNLSMLIGNMGGSMGEVAALALLLGFGYLLIRRVITWHIPISIIMTVIAFTATVWLIDSDLCASPVFHLFTGGLLLGAIYMATDYSSSPMSHKGMLLYGVGIGVLTVVIRIFGAYPEGISFAILIMNAFVPLINKYIKPARFGKEVKNG
jgi:electron transport complex protein RnfD